MIAVYNLKTEADMFQKAWFTLAEVELTGISRRPRTCLI